MHKNTFSQNQSKITKTQRQTYKNTHANKIKTLKETHIDTQKHSETQTHINIQKHTQTGT